MADIGSDVIGGNARRSTNLMHVLVPTTDLTNEYHEALNCTLTGMIDFASESRPTRLRVSTTSAPSHSASTAIAIRRICRRSRQAGGPQCNGQLPVRVQPLSAEGHRGHRHGAAGYGNQGILLNSDGLKQWLFGPIDGPPRNICAVGTARMSIRGTA